MAKRRKINGHIGVARQKSAKEKKPKLKKAKSGTPTSVQRVPKLRQTRLNLLKAQQPLDFTTPPRGGGRMEKAPDPLSPVLDANNWSPNNIWTEVDYSQSRDVGTT